MNAVIIFLVIFAGASFFSRIAHATLFMRFLAAPVFITVGLFLSQSGLGLLRLPSLDGLDLFTQTAIAWVSFLLGIKKLAYTKNHKSQLAIRSIQLLCNLVITAVLTLIAIWLITPTSFMQLDDMSLLALLLLIACLLFGRETYILGRARISNFNLTVMAMLGMLPFLFLIYNEDHPTFLRSCTPFIAGFFAAWVTSHIEKLILKILDADIKIVVLSLISMCSIIAGVCLWFGFPHAIVGFLFGVFISFEKKRPILFLRELLLSEQPVMIVLMILTGAHLSPRLEPLLCGALLGALIHLMRFFMRRLQANLKARPHFRAGYLGSSNIALLFLGSLFFVFPDKRPLINDLVLLVLAATSLGDLLGVARWSYVLGRRLKKIPSPVVMD